MNGLDKKEMWKSFLKEEIATAFNYVLVLGIIVAIIICPLTEKISMTFRIILAGVIAVFFALGRGNSVGFGYDTGMRPVGTVAGLVTGAIHAPIIFFGLAGTTLAYSGEKTTIFLLILFSVSATVTAITNISDRSSKKFMPRK